MDITFDMVGKMRYQFLSLTLTLPVSLAGKPVPLVMYVCVPKQTAPVQSRPDSIRISKGQIRPPPLPHPGMLQCRSLRRRTIRLTVIRDASVEFPDKCDHANGAGAEPGLPSSESGGPRRKDVDDSVSRRKMGGG